MTRERLVQGILQSVATVAFLPQIRLVIEAIEKITLIPDLLLQTLPKGMVFLIDFILVVPLDLSLEMKAAMKRHTREFWRYHADDHHPRDENGNLIDTGCSCHHHKLTGNLKSR